MKKNSYFDDEGQFDVQQPVSLTFRSTNCYRIFLNFTWLPATTTYGARQRHYTLQLIPTVKMIENFSWFVLAHFCTRENLYQSWKELPLSLHGQILKTQYFFYFLQLCSCLNDLEYIRRTLLELPERLNLPQVTCFWHQKRTNNDNFCWY